MRCCICDHRHNKHNPVTLFTHPQSGYQEDLCFACYQAIYLSEETYRPKTIGEALLGDDELEVPLDSDNQEAPTLPADGDMEFLATTLANDPKTPALEQPTPPSVDSKLGSAHADTG